MSDAHYVSLRDRLQRKAKRPLDRTRDAIAQAPPAPISVTRAHEISALAVGLLVLKHVEDTGRTRLHEQAIQESLKRVTNHLNAAEMMRLEVEAYEIVDWLVGGNGSEPNADFVAQKTEGGVRYDPSSSVPEIVREAVAQGFDLKIAYYSSKRMEMNSRTISPKAIAAEVYVRAWCHERRDERIFRMDRIRSAVPVGGIQIRNQYLERVLSEQHAEQQSFELEHLSFSFDDESSSAEYSESATTPPWAEPTEDAQPKPAAKAQRKTARAAPTNVAAKAQPAASAVAGAQLEAAEKAQPETQAKKSAKAPTNAAIRADEKPAVAQSTPSAAEQTKPAEEPQTSELQAERNSNANASETAKNTLGGAAKPPSPSGETAKASKARSAEGADQKVAPAPVLTLSATPTDKELRALEIKRLRAEEKEAARIAAAEAPSGDDDDQLTFF